MQATASGSVFDFRYVLNDYETTNTRALPQGGAVDSAIYRDGVADQQKMGRTQRSDPCLFIGQLEPTWIGFNITDAVIS